METHSATESQSYGLEIAREAMEDFAYRTGLNNSTHPPARYLWTDAFAVCNFLRLFLRSGDPHYLALAQDLVKQVHQVLGRHREDDSRFGWISGLNETDGSKHPTRGGLRIGKPLPERNRQEKIDEITEWERDGQYFHYLTRWMYALGRIAEVSGEPTYLRWAIELARTAHRAFVYQPISGLRKRMVWKTSIDLSYPLVTSMGHHDPLEGLVTFLQIQSSGEKLGLSSQDCDLRAEISDMEKMCRGVSFRTPDPLGIGGLLMNARALTVTIADSPDPPPEAEWLETILGSSESSLVEFGQTRTFERPVESRLAFRELGLSIGLHGVEEIRSLLRERTSLFRPGCDLLAILDRITRFSFYTDVIEQFWIEPENQRSHSWKNHLDINSVMLATSLLSAEFPEDTHKSTSAGSA